MKDCLFCGIVSKEIESDIFFEDEEVMIIKDISPVAPVHYLVIPKKHIRSIMEIDMLKESTIKNIMVIIKKMAAELGLDRNGFRVVTNMGLDGGQSVDHLHFHLMGQRKFTWPPG